ncbi:uncharacterized protein YALI1_D09916g [Yarrowia lipolytica]|uniref:Uncharacterized protein n=1 Tax=Yarrowia lipolytica TaxID=4952 RepID=A0A1D8NDN3_YARLL|nr:hypothetical protein YALI1_D09916g [Yarrowia lipolytica]
MCHFGEESMVGELSRSTKQSCDLSVPRDHQKQSTNRARDGGRPCQVVARLERLAPKPICYVTTRWFQTIMISSWGWAYSWQPNRYAGPVNKAPLPQT